MKDIHPATFRDTRWGKRKDIQQIPGVTSELLEDLIKLGCISRVVQHKDEAHPREYWLIDKILAESHNLQFKVDWVTDFHKADGEWVPSWYLTDDGFVTWLSTVKRLHRPSAREYWPYSAFGPLCRGYDDLHGNRHLIYNKSFDVRKGKIKLLLTHDPYEGWHPRMGLGPDPRTKVFVDIFMATKNPVYAYQIAFDERSTFKANHRVKQVMKTDRVRQLMDQKLSDAMEKVFKDHEIVYTPEEWVISTMMDIIETAKNIDKPAALSTAINGLTKISEFLQMSKSTKVKETKSIELKLTEGGKNRLLANGENVEAAEIVETVEEPDVSSD